MNRRQVLAATGAFGLVSLSGCLGLAGLDDHESTAGGVDADTRESTDYQQVGVDDITIEESVGVGPVEESVRVVNYLTEHEKTVDMGPLGEQRGAVFMVLTTPRIGIPNYQFNPVEDMSTHELVELVEDNYDEMDDIEHQEDYSMTILDQETTASRFTASAQFEGEDVDVYLHVSEAVETDDDLLVTIGVYPQEVANQEEDNVDELMENVVKEADESEGNGDEDDGDDDSDNEADSDEGDGDEDDEESDDGLV
ncbi:DUF6517 family protein [Natranaeroarchaeum sulfidigenes]|uniref:Uncharacterized protein n=1 Tax=Natranaeroarchaeum sulfidigenes TaxID=2784880 RepID=A0A897MNE1_9EURY|nr:DUF6517 family protein [Natranaeroarchaeum sulfidigenes]QSG01922.1 Uncharacterized protein AArcS_0697 [Natranaeroarchaeum sulfidigenes]